MLHNYRQSCTQKQATMYTTECSLFFQKFFCFLICFWIVPDFQNSAHKFLSALFDAKLLIYIIHQSKTSKDNIVLGTDTVIGLYDRMNGAGSDFEIQLEEDMVIPTTMVQIVQMESSGRDDVVNSKDNIGYSVEDTYGFVGTQWQDSYKGITDKAPTLIQENMKETYEKLNNFEPEKDDVIKDDKEDDFGLD